MTSHRLPPRHEAPTWGRVVVVILAAACSTAPLAWLSGAVLRSPDLGFVAWVVLFLAANALLFRYTSNRPSRVRPDLYERTSEPDGAVAPEVPTEAAPAASFRPDSDRHSGDLLAGYDPMNEETMELPLPFNDPIVEAAAQALARTKIDGANIRRMTDAQWAAAWDNLTGYSRNGFRQQAHVMLEAAEKARRGLPDYRPPSPRVRTITAAVRHADDPVGPQTTAQRQANVVNDVIGRARHAAAAGQTTEIDLGLAPGAYMQTQDLVHEGSEEPVGRVVVGPEENSDAWYLARIEERLETVPASERSAVRKPMEGMSPKDQYHLVESFFVPDEPESISLPQVYFVSPEVTEGHYPAGLPVRVPGEHLDQGDPTADFDREEEFFEQRAEHLAAVGPTVVDRLEAGEDWSGPELDAQEPVFVSDREDEDR